TRQAPVNALVRALKWIGGRSAEEVAAVMPPDYALGNAALYQQSVKTNLPTFSRDGRFYRLRRAQGVRCRCRKRRGRRGGGLHQWIRGESAAATVMMARRKLRSFPQKRNLGAAVCSSGSPQRGPRDASVAGCPSRGRAEGG